MKTDVYQAITDKIVAAIEAGNIAPWSQPFDDRGGFPISLSTKRKYRGVNVLLLSLEGHSDPRWGTYRAIKEAGGQVRKGEKSTNIVFWKRVPKKKEAGSNENPGSYWFLRSFSVFNATQADGLPELEGKVAREFTPIEEAQRIVDGYAWTKDNFLVEGKNRGPNVIVGYNLAAYDPFKDQVLMPKPEQFVSDEGYYSTLFHELIHSTGHESRLKRIEPAAYGSDPYAKEELVAEIGASFLGGVAGFASAGGDQSAAYVAGWLRPLKEDSRLIITAASQAQKAADLILGTDPESLEPTQQDPQPAVMAGAI